MQAIDDWQTLRDNLNHVLIARDTMRNRSIPQHRRDQATAAYSRGVDRIVDALTALQDQPIVAGSAAPSVLDQLGEVLAAIAQAEDQLRRVR